MKSKKKLILTQVSTYKDGGTTHYRFSDGFDCYYSKRSDSTNGKWYYEYPTIDQKPMREVPEKYKELIRERR